MTIASALIPDWLAVGLWGLLLATVALAARFAQWRAVASVPARWHSVFGGIVFCTVLWLMSVRVIDGLWLHFLGITTLTLVLGWRFAMLSGTVAVCLHTWLIGESWPATSPAWLLTVAIPATVSRLLVHLLRKLKSRNLFIYMLGAGFGGGMLSVLCVAVVAIPLMWLIGQDVWVGEALASWPLVTLMCFPEGFINGMVVSTLTVFYPSMVKTFDDHHYLEEQ